MKHARMDFDSVQDSSRRIPFDEPVFLLRGQDKHINKVIAFYIYLVLKDMGDDNIIEALRMHMKRVDEWQKERKVKAPDIKKAAINYED